MKTLNPRPLFVEDSVDIESRAGAGRHDAASPLAAGGGMQDPKLMLRVANAIEEQNDWTRQINNVSVGMWFAVAVRPGACGSLLSGLAAMYFPETRVFGDPGRAFHAAVREALVMS